MNDPYDRLYESPLVLRCQAGDEAAFVELVGRYHQPLRLFLRQMLGTSTPPTTRSRTSG